MSLKYMLTTIYNPVKTFEDVKARKPNFFDALLIFGFVYTLILSVGYVVFSLFEISYGMEELILLFLDVSPIVFFQSPNLVTFLISFGIGLTEVLVFTGVVFILSRRAGGEGSFPSLFMTFSLSRVISIITIFALLILRGRLYYGEFLGIVFLVSTIVGIYIWRIALYFIGIKTNYKFSPEMSFIITIASWVLYSLIAGLVVSFFVHGYIGRVLAGMTEIVSEKTMSEKTMILPPTID